MSRILHRFLDLLRPLSPRLAEIRERQQRHPWLIAKSTGDASGFHGNLGQLLSGGHLVNRRVGHEHGASAGKAKRQANDAMAGLFVDHMPHVIEDTRVIAGGPGHHGVRIAERHHGGGEMVAVLIDQALTVAEQETPALEALIEELRIGAVAMGQARIVKLDALASFKFDPGCRSRLENTLLASDQNGLAETLIDERNRGADHLLLLAFGEHHALGETAHAFEDAVERSGNRIAARRELRLVAAHVDDRPPRDAAIHGGACATAVGMVWIRRGSNGTGMMYSRPKRGREP